MTEKTPAQKRNELYLRLGLSLVVIAISAIFMWSSNQAYQREMRLNKEGVITRARLIKEVRRYKTAPILKVEYFAMGEQVQTEIREYWDKAQNLDRKKETTPEGKEIDTFHVTFDKDKVTDVKLGYGPTDPYPRIAIGVFGLFMAMIAGAVFKSTLRKIRSTLKEERGPGAA